MRQWKYDPWVCRDRLSEREQHRIRHPFRCRCGFSAFFLQKGDFRLVKGKWGCMCPVAACANRPKGQVRFAVPSRMEA
jgi:hypothetical protein